MNFAQPKFSIQEVNAAGRMLLRSTDEELERWSDADWNDYSHAIDVINNWRGSHAYPLNTFTVNLRLITRKLTEDPLVAQRIKRLPSISLKLQLNRSMKLSQMQDLGGCRAILTDISSVRNVVNYYHNVSRIQHNRQPTDDYIANPKTSGYRGIHLIYRYFSDKRSNKMYNGLKIEMQIRTRYQHAFATAVETVGMFSGQALKSNLGSREWRRFFSLMGSVIALRERSPLVPGTPETRGELISELRHYVESLQVGNRLREYGRALHAISTASDDSYFYLLELNPAKGTLGVSGFALKDALLAERKYAEAEAAAKDVKGDAVLVSVDSLNALGKAYPNYFADTRLFVELMDQALSGQSRGIKTPEPKMQVQGSLPFPKAL